MARENVSVSLSWADPMELWIKFDHREKLNPLTFFLIFFPSHLSLQHYGFLLYYMDQGSST